MHDDTLIQNSVTGNPVDANPILRPEWWQNLAPSLSLSNSPYAAVKPLVMDAGSESAIRQLILQEGYVQGSVGQWKLPLTDMVNVVVKLKGAGLMPVFALAYEEFWLLAHQLGNVVNTLLGGEYYMLPDFWMWHVDPQKDESGWKPHRDKSYGSLLADGMPKSVTLWIPLTAATTLNGCMYVVPADRDPTYGTPNDKDWRFEYQDVRALPAVPGDFFVWNQAVLHWGSHASPRGGAARVSIAFEFQRKDIPPMNSPLIQAGTIPNFAQRMNLIGKQVLQYKHMYPLSPELAAIANAMAIAPNTTPFLHMNNSHK
ncbi:phytanoyl-CoA dioxygenase family protein [Undibacterium flavidum]|uniref:Phytanoyl-CoA dioxygenase family protein n=1 Tax=Undibacterium flavidum TaxID=2762297 RepID=A0ABR6Y6W8_9BURK|nr:phytanoyl-CoA dioxygenase family protein [Undibacterium flavidum]MBC3872360.1 phytanoyl-CoA dioxygenase family protein [Undibacterium flavidum]